MSDRNKWLKELGYEESLWANNVVLIPSMINVAYTYLKELAMDGQVYGVMLQCKDIYERLYKIPVIMSMIVIDSYDQNKEEKAYSKIINTFLSTPMSMGQWDALASSIVKNAKNLKLSDSLIEILKRTRKLYSEEISPNVPDVINWRNDAIGHGALKFEDDDSYKCELKSLICLLKEYFDGDGKFSIKNLYDSVYFASGEARLIGNYNLPLDADKELKLFVDNAEYKVDYYTNTNDLKCYLFDSYYCKKNLIKYSSYLDGKSEWMNSKYFSDLYEKRVLKPDLEASVQSEYISREEDMVLEYLNMPMEYIKPTFLVDRLTESMDGINSGVISIFMERGTGKSAFSNQMSGLYHKNSLIRNSFSRCYHIQNAALRGNGDFVNSINFSYRHSYDPSQDLWGSSDELPVLKMDSLTPDKDLASFLNYFHRKYKKEYSILVIDGIDEITEQTGKIIDYIPKSDLLDDGVFIVLLSRFKDEDTVIGNSKKYIEIAEKISDIQICVKRKDSDNEKVLLKFVENQIKNGNVNNTINPNKQIERADYRFLYLKAYLAIGESDDLINENEFTFVRSYLNNILSFYGPSQKRMIKEIAVTIALFPSLSIQKYHEYMNYDITYDFVGLVNDLLPLLTVWHMNGEDVYSFADSAYSSYVLNEYFDVGEEIIDSFYQSLEISLKKYLINGCLVRENVFGDVHSIDEMNNNIIFFTEGIIGLWNHSVDNECIRKKFFKNHIPVALCGQLSMDSWIKTGYAHYVSEELRDCLGSAIYYCLQNYNDTCARLWYELLCREFKRIKKGVFSVYKNFQYCIRQSKCIDDIINYLLKNYDSIKLDDWFWVLEARISDDVISILEQSDGSLERFMDYIFYADDYYYKNKWIKKINGIKLFPPTEEHYLNLLLKEYISYKGWQGNSTYYDLARSCFEKIKNKGYQIDDSIDYDKLSEIINLEAGFNISVELKEKITSAINRLMDFDTPWKDLSDETSLTFDAYIELKSIKARGVDAIDVGELHSAFLKRMIYERDKGNLGLFIKAEILLDDFIIDILRNEYGNDEDLIESINGWIDCIKKIINKDNVSSINVLSSLMIGAIEWYFSHKNIEKAEKLLFDYIYNVETKAFFKNHFSGMITSAIEPNIIYGENPFVYCSNNTIYLLDYYRENNLTDNFNALMTKIEEDVPLIDADHKTDMKSQAYCEIQKFKFMKYRKEIGYSSKFDEYLNAMLQSHQIIIEKCLLNLSRKSDFNELAFHIELLLEYAWQSHEWTWGMEMSDNLINILESVNHYHDIVVEQSVNKQLDIIRICHDFFSAIFSRDLNKFCMEKKKHIDSYYFLPYGIYTALSHGDRIKMDSFEDKIVLKKY